MGTSSVYPRYSLGLHWKVFLREHWKLSLDFQGELHIYLELCRGVIYHLAMNELRRGKTITLTLLRSKGLVHDDLKPSSYSSPVLLIILVDSDPQDVEADVLESPQVKRARSSDSGE